MISPTAYCFNKENVKAFVLGADPSNFSEKGKTKILTTVFGIGDGDRRYFSGILKNLNMIGLSLEDIYVQNLITDYLKEETTKNKRWEFIAKDYIEDRKLEFDGIDKTGNIPVLVTAERIYKFLINDDIIYHKAAEFYNCQADIPINSGDNKLGRPLIPFYRNHKYSLNNWEDYKNRIIEIIK